MNDPDRPIGIFDSGIGGLTVMRELTKKLPKEKIVYFGDTARLPYGDKSKETIIRYSIENAIFLLEQNVKLLVVACNTASALALDKLEKIFKIPVLGVIAPGAEIAARTTKNKRIAVLGTKGTIGSGAYQREIQKRKPEVEVYTLACPLFVPLVEERFYTHPAANLIIQEYFRSLHPHQVDTVLLGCTHYPLLKERIAQELPEGTVIIDSAQTCADKVAELLSEKGLETPSQGSPDHQFYVSDDPAKFSAMGAEFLGKPLKQVLLQRL